MMTYSRPSALKPPNPLSMRRSGRVEATCDADDGNALLAHSKARYRGLDRSTPPYLVGERASAVGEDRTRDRLQQGAVLDADLVGGAHENSAGAVDDVGFDARGDESHDLVVQHLAIAAALLVPDHEVDFEPLEAPVSVRLDELTHELDVVGTADLQKHDGQITGDRIAPQARLASSISGDHARFGPQRCAGVENRAGQASVELRISFGDIELAQHDLAVGPRHLERAIREPPILVLFHQGMASGAILADTGDEIHRHGLFRREGDALPDGDDRIQHGALGAGQRTRRCEAPAGWPRCCRGQ